MKKKIVNILKSIFSVFIILSLFGGSLVFLIFLLAILMGASYGESLALFAYESLIPLLIKFATVGVFSGLIYIYIEGFYPLSLKKDKS